MIISLGAASLRRRREILAESNDSRGTALNRLGGLKEALLADLCLIRC
jgi:hypothetical protein